VINRCSAQLSEGLRTYLPLGELEEEIGYGDANLNGLRVQTPLVWMIGPLETRSALPNAPNFRFGNYHYKDPEMPISS
jgi:hypothetical protein